jgi:hypothetical protein
MRPVRRVAVRKKSSVRKFKKQMKRTKAANMNAIPMRGGYRF